MAHAARPPTLPPVDILLIEENLADARLFREALKAGDLAGQVAVLETECDVRAFVQHVHASSPLLTVLDSGVPGMSVEEMMETLRMQPGCANVPVIFLSSLDEQKEHWRGVRCGAMGFVHTPLDFQRYCDTIHAMMRSGVAQTASLNS